MPGEQAMVQRPEANLVKQREREQLLETLRSVREGNERTRRIAAIKVMSGELRERKEKFVKAFIETARHFEGVRRKNLRAFNEGQLRELADFLAEKAKPWAILQRISYPLVSISLVSLYLKMGFFLGDAAFWFFGGMGTFIATVVLTAIIYQADSLVYFRCHELLKSHSLDGQEFFPFKELRHELTARKPKKIVESESDPEG